MGDRQQRIKSVKADWSDIVLVCRKCSKKLRGGFGPDGDQSLRKALSKGLPDRIGPRPDGHEKRRRRSLAVLEVDCQDLCPKNAVVVLRPALANTWFIVPKGTPVAAVAAELGIGRETPVADAPAEAAWNRVRNASIPSG